jgi:prevent-host-death family protein
MITITAFEAKTRFGELLDRVERGEEIVITRHDKPVARIRAAAVVPDLAAIRITVDAIRDFGRKHPLNPPGRKRLRIRDLINEGRPE